jgi:hypothetical protein
MTEHNLRYYGLAAYTGLVALFTGLDKIDISDPSVAAAVLAPIVIVITADIYKHKSNV